MQIRAPIVVDAGLKHMSRNFMPKGATWSFIMSSYFGPHHLSAKPRRSESPYQNS